MPTTLATPFGDAALAPIRLGEPQGATARGEQLALPNLWGLICSSIVDARAGDTEKSREFNDRVCLAADRNRRGAARPTTHAARR